MERHKVKSGMSGWAQVNGLRGDTSIPERVQYDLYYIEKLVDLVLNFKDNHSYNHRCFIKQFSPSQNPPK